VVRNEQQYEQCRRKGGAIAMMPYFYLIHRCRETFRPRVYWVFVEMMCTVHMLMYTQLPFCRPPFHHRLTLFRRLAASGSEQDIGRPLTPVRQDTGLSREPSCWDRAGASLIWAPVVDGEERLGDKHG
jgi:hypothetical protein